MRTGWKATCEVTVWDSDQVTQKEERTAAETVPWTSEIVRRKIQSSLFPLWISILLLVFSSIQPTSSLRSPVAIFLPISVPFQFSSPLQSIPPNPVLPLPLALLNNNCFVANPFFHSHASSFAHSQSFPIQFPFDNHQCRIRHTRFPLPPANPFCRTLFAGQLFLDDRV